MKYFISVSCVMLLLLSCFFQDEGKVNSVHNQWKHDSTVHFKLHAQTGVRSEDSLKNIGQKLEGVQQELLNMISETEPQSLEIYFLKNRETLTSYTGFPAKGYTNTNKGIIYFVDKDPFHLAFRHELMHALSWRLWGNPKGYWLSEGIAVFAAGKCAVYNLHTLAHEISKENKIIPFEEMTDTMDFCSLEPSLQSASMIKYIYEVYGINALKKLWQNGLQNTSNIIGISATALEQKWRKHIDQEKFEGNINWDKLKQSGCE